METLIGAAAEVILTSLSSFAIEEIGLASSVKQDLDDFKTKGKILRPPLLISLISAVLRDAQTPAECNTLWIREMKNAIYDADDVLEEFKYKRLSNPIGARKIAHKMKDINMKLDRVVKHGTYLGLTQVLRPRVVGESSSSPQDSRQTHPFVDRPPMEPPSNISPNVRSKPVIRDWDKGELLGRGSFGSVYEGITEDGFFFAIKEVSLIDQGSQAKQCIVQLEQEIDLLSRFEHENIVQYYGTKKDEKNLYIFLELVTKGSLQSLYQKYNLRDTIVSEYTRQILHGLKYLHDQGVVHRDIKCANILVDANGSVKLADFGLAKATKLNDVKSCKGTAFWMAPEVVNRENHGYGLPADIWSLGCTVLEMVTRQIPYSHLECMQALFRIGRGEPPPVPPVSDDFPADARDFILQCLQVNPNDRPPASQLLDHRFIKCPMSTSSGSASPFHFGGRI